MGSTGIKSSREFTPGTLEFDDRIRSESDYVGTANIEQQIYDYLRYNMPPGAESVSVNTFRIDTNPGNGIMGDVEAEYQINYRIPEEEIDADGIRHTYYIYESEYLTDRFQVVLRKR